MKEIKNLKKINETLNSKGTILGLLKYNDKYYFSSSLNGESGRVYWSVEEPVLASYFNNQLKLQDVFFASEDIIVPRYFRKEAGDLKKQLADLITCGKRLFFENSDGMRNDSLAEVFVR